MNKLAITALLTSPSFSCSRRARTPSDLKPTREVQAMRSPLQSTG